jgi:uncharacterized membrane protein
MPLDLKDPNLHDALTRAVEDAEAHTDAELVVVVTRAVGDASREAVLAGGLAAWLATAAMCWSPLTFHDLLLPVESAIVGFLAWAAVRRSPGLARALRTRARAAAELEASIRDAWHTEGVGDTPGRVGVLLLVDASSGTVHVRVDSGVRARLPDTILATVEAGFAAPDTDALTAGITTLGTTLGAWVPDVRREDIRESTSFRRDLDNRPRVRP